MSTQVEVVYPSVSSYSSAAQLNIGPFFVPGVNRLLRAEVHGRVNFQGINFGPTSVQANTELWAIQWVPSGSSPADCVLTADGPNWLIRQQLGENDALMFWTPDTNSAAVLGALKLDAWWAGQLAIGQDIDLWLSAKAPTGAVFGNINLFASLRFWWS